MLNDNKTEFDSSEFNLKGLNSLNLESKFSLESLNSLMKRWLFKHGLQNTLYSIIYLKSQQNPG